MIGLQYAWRQMRQHPGRAGLSILSVVLATAAIVAVAAVIATTREAYQQVFQSLAGPADLEVISRESEEFPEKLVAVTRSVPGIRTILPVFRRISILYFNGERTKIIAVGLVPDEAESTSGLKPARGRLPKSGAEVAIESVLAENLHVAPGDTVKLLTSRGMRRYQVVGLFQLESAARVRQGAMLLAPMAQLQADFRAAGKIDSLQVFLKSSGDLSSSLAAISAQLPPTLEVQVPAARHGLADETLLLTNVSLTMAGSLTLTTALFIVLGIFLISVGERRPQLSLMHALGATRLQIVEMICSEALLLGIAGTFIGIPCGIYGGRFLMSAMSNLLRTNLPTTPDVTWALGTGIICGPAISLLAALYPAIKASQVTPLEGMRPTVSIAGETNYKRYLTPAAIGLMIAIIGSLLAATQELPIWVSVASAVIALISIVVLLPALLPLLVNGLGRLLNPVLGVVGEISQRTVLRRVGRSSLTVGVLFVAVAAAVGIGNAAFSVTEDVQSWYKQTTTADFLLRTMMPDLTGRQSVRMDESLTKEIASFHGVMRVESLSAQKVEVAGHRAVLVAREFGLYPRPPLDLVGDMPTQVQTDLLSGSVALGSVLATRLGAKPGDTIQLSIEGQSQAFRVAGIVTEYTFGGLVVFIDRPVAKRLLGVQGVDCYLIKASPTAGIELRHRLEQLAKREGLLLQSFQELLSLIDSMVAGVTNGLWILLALGLLVGGIGVVNTLTVNILEQTTEIGMLRAVGMDRRQLFAMVAGQAAIFGSIGVLLGAAAGLSLAHGINFSLAHLFGREITFAIHPILLASLVVAAIAMTLFAALIPAWRATTLNPVQAMRAT